MKFLNQLKSLFSKNASSQVENESADPKKSILLKNCDWLKLHQAYCTVSFKNYLKLQHIEIIAGIQELHLQTTGPCKKETCVSYDHIIHTEYALALIELIDIALMELSEASMATDKIKNDLIDSLTELFNDSAVLGKIQVATPNMDRTINDTYETLSRIKTQLQK